jgi:enoyl-CoA hydratase/carnithine racemase
MIPNIAPGFYVKYGRRDVTWDFDFDVTDGVATIALNRPEKLNALTFEVYAQLRDLLAQLPHRGDARVLVITGRGRGFCSGGDVEEIIGELVKREAAELREFTRMTGAVVKGLRELPMPVIAAVNGTAAGAGSVIALAADFRLLAQSASFAFLFTRVGLSGADMGSAYLLPRIVGLGRATEILMLGDKIDAQRALEIGLATEVVADEELPERAATLAQRLADGPALAYSATKAALIREQDSDLGTAIEIEALTQALLMKSEDFSEFYNAWHEGRKPQWRGR